MEKISWDAKIYLHNANFHKFESLNEMVRIYFVLFIYLFIYLFIFCFCFCFSIFISLYLFWLQVEKIKLLSSFKLISNQLVLANFFFKGGYRCLRQCLLNDRCSHYKKLLTSSFILTQTNNAFYYVIFWYIKLLKWPVSTE